MFCGSCGAQQANDVRFCVACGNRLGTEPIAVAARREPLLICSETLPIICRSLVRQLDSARARWFELTKELMVDVLTGELAQLVNNSFDCTTPIRIWESDSPKSYSFNVIDGIHVEGTIISWQMQNVHALVRKRQYIKEQHQEDFIAAWFQAFQNDPRWIQAVAASCSEEPVNNDCIAVVLGHYVLGDPTESPGMLAICQVIKNSMACLRALTYLGTAGSFADEETVQQITKDMGIE